MTERRMEGEKKRGGDGHKVVKRLQMGRLSKQKMKKESV